MTDTIFETLPQMVSDTFSLPSVGRPSPAGQAQAPRQERFDFFLQACNGHARSHYGKDNF